MGKLTIEITGTADWGCDRTDEDVEAYSLAVRVEVEACYPGAEVSYTEDTIVATKVRVTGAESDAVAEQVEQAVKGIAQTVWDDAAFWPEPAE